MTGTTAALTANGPRQPGLRSTSSSAKTASATARTTSLFGMLGGPVARRATTFTSAG
jgi:hypothetical protein